MPAKKRPATKVSKNQKLRRVNLLSSTLEPKKTHRTSWPGYSPVVGLFVIVLVALIVGAGLYYLSTKTKSTNTNSTVGLETNKNSNANSNSVACTMEAKLCSDGSYVSRIPPDCQFAACPGETNMNLNSNANVNSNTNSNTNTAGWQTYMNQTGGYSIQYPANWMIDTTRNIGSNSVVFEASGSAGEAVEGIEFDVTAKTLDQWAAEFETGIVESVTATTIDGKVAKRVDTTEFGQDYIGVRNGDKLYIFTSNGTMFTNGMLNTFQFSQ